MPAPTGTLSLASGTFTSPWNTPGAQTKLLADTRNGVQTVTASQNGTLDNVFFAGNSAASNIALRAGTNLVATNSSYDFAGGNDILVISSTLNGSSSGTVVSNSTFSLGSGSDKFTVNGGASNVTVDAGVGADNIEVKGNTSGSTFLAGNDNDNLIFRGNVTNSTVIGGAGNDSFTFRESVNGSTIIGDSGRDSITFSNAVTNSGINSGDDNDTIRFNSSVNTTNIATGSGKDLLIFGGTINAVTNVNLGGQDGAIDTIEIARGVAYGGLKITGASQGDILIIGSTKYTYNPLSDKWINPSKSPLTF